MAPIITAIYTVVMPKKATMPSKFSLNNTNAKNKMPVTRKTIGVIIAAVNHPKRLIMPFVRKIRVIVAIPVHMEKVLIKAK